MQGQVVKLGDRLESRLARYAVMVEVPQGGGVIGAGPITGRIIRAWVEYQGLEVTEVPEGENFVVAVDYSAANPGFFPTPLDPAWSTSVTVISTDGEVKGYNSTLEFSATERDLIRVELGPMPAYNITLWVKIWGNQAVWTMPGVPDTAPEDQW